MADQQTEFFFAQLINKTFDVTADILNFTVCALQTLNLLNGACPKWTKLANLQLRKFPKKPNADLPMENVAKVGNELQF